MKTIVITGGTDGMGKAVALSRLGRGDDVIVVGPNPEKGKAFLEAASQSGWGAQVRFIEADLSLVAENRRVIDDIAKVAPAIDALILCARHFRSARAETREGFEYSFALEYLSRFVLSHGLAGVLAKADRPIIVNVSGPGIPKPEIRWSDIGFTHGYDGVAAQFHAGRANDLLAVSFASMPCSRQIGYVLINPGAVSTSFSGQYDAATLAHIDALKQFGKPVEEGIRPILACIETPPDNSLTIMVENRKIVPDEEQFSPAAAAKLDALTRQWLAT